MSLVKRDLSVEDEFLWLENIDDPKVREWALQRSKRVYEELGVLSDKLFKRILEYYRIPYYVQVVLTKKDLYGLLREYDSYKIVKIKRDGSREVLVDSRDLGENIVIKWIDAPEDGNRLVYSYSSGSDEGITRIMDPSTGEVLDELYGVVGDFVWLSPDKYYYVRFYRTGETPDGVKAPAERVFLRENGKEEMVWGKGLSTNYMIGLDESSDHSKALITISIGWSVSIVYAGDLRDPSTWEKIYGDDQHRFHPIDYVGDKYYILAFDKEGMGRIVAYKPGGEIVEVVGEHNKYPLRSAWVFGDKILAYYLVDASARLKTFDLNGKLVDELKFDPPGIVSSIRCLDSQCVFKYESIHIPYRLYMYDGSKLELVDKEEISGLDIGIEEFWVESSDKTMIHVFKVYNREGETKKAILYGYGGFNVPILPSYRPYIIPFLEDKGTYFIANIRGGGEYGEKWHKAGMRENKENVFQDFIAVARYLKMKGYKIAVLGSSNGGLLTATTMVKAPELIDAVVIGYPVLDMLRFHKLFIGKLWTTEYGDPDNPRDREYLLKYSPYHNLKPGVKYPPALIYTGLYDDRVHPGHAFKFAAKLEKLGVKYYLRVETVSGHSGASPLVKAREYADILAFIYKMLRLTSK